MSIYDPDEKETEFKCHVKVGSKSNPREGCFSQKAKYGGERRCYCSTSLCDNSAADFAASAGFAVLMFATVKVWGY